jgi:MFS family permease
MLAVCTAHTRAIVLGTFAALSTFVIFYLMTVFSLSWATSELGYPRTQFLFLQMVGVLFFALTIPLSALWADRRNPVVVLIVADVSIIVFGLLFAPLFGSGSAPVVLLFLCIGLALMGLIYGPLGTVLTGLFPAAVRYTGASLSFNLAGIFGASLAPYLATGLARNHGLPSVGYYLSAAGIVSLIALTAMRGNRDPFNANR